MSDHASFSLHQKGPIDRGGPTGHWGTLREVAATLESEGIPLSRLSCLDCSSWRTCEYAFDPYNTDGDCLAEK
jgi:hypothetical protein